MRIDAGIAAERHLHAGLPCRLEGLPLAQADLAFLGQAGFRHAVLRAFGQDIIIVVDIHGKPGAGLLGQLERLGIGEADMFHRVHAGADRGLDAVGAMGMGSHLQAQHVRLIHQRVHFGLGVLLGANAGTDREDAAGGAIFDHFGAAPVQFTHLLAHAIRPISNAGAIKDIIGRQFVAVTMPAGGTDGIGGWHDAWAGDGAALDRHFQGKIGVIAGTDIAHGGEARINGAFGHGGAQHGPERGRIAERLHPRQRGIAGQVHVHVDQAGQNSQRAQIDALAIGHRQFALPADLGDAAIFNDDDRLLHHRAAGHVQHSAGGDHHGFGAGRHR